MFCENLLRLRRIDHIFVSKVPLWSSTSPTNTPDTGLWLYRFCRHLRKYIQLCDLFSRKNYIIDHTWVYWRSSNSLLDFIYIIQRDIQSLIINRQAEQDGRLQVSMQRWHGQSPVQTNLAQILLLNLKVHVRFLLCARQVIQKPLYFLINLSFKLVVDEKNKSSFKKIFELLAQIQLKMLSNDLYHQTRPCASWTCCKRRRLFRWTAHRLFQSSRTESPRFAAGFAYWTVSIWPGSSAACCCRPSAPTCRSRWPCRFARWSDTSTARTLSSRPRFPLLIYRLRLSLTLCH